LNLLTDLGSERYKVSRINKKFILFSIMLFVLITTVFALPVMAFAEEDATVVEPAPENLIIDINYQDLNGDGIAGSKFDFKMDVTFEGEGARLFEFVNTIPEGWSVVINAGTSNGDIPKIKLQPLKKESIKINITPLVDQQPGEYDINIIIRPVEESDILEAEAKFTAIVKPVGELKFEPSKGIFSSVINSSSNNIYKLALENTGTSPVENISITSSGDPEGWQIEFEKEIDVIDVGEKKEIDISISPSEKTIAGEYNIRFMANSEESSNSLLVRFTVVTPLIWKIVGICLILVVVVGIAFIFARLGKR